MKIRFFCILAIGLLMSCMNPDPDPDPNKTPIAIAGGNRLVALLSIVQLNGSDSYDDDGDTLSYNWQLISQPVYSTTTISTSDIVNPTITIDVVGDYVINLIVNDGEVNSTPSSLTISVVEFVGDCKAEGWIGAGSESWIKTSDVSSGDAYNYFNSPKGISIDTSNNLYIVDYWNSRISKWSSSGVAAGWIGGGFDGWQTTPGTQSGGSYKHFYNPMDLDLDASGNIYIVEEHYSRVLKWNATGNAVGWIGGGDDGWKTRDAEESTEAGSEYQKLDFPHGICVDSLGNIYIADFLNNRVSKWNADGFAQGWIGGGSDGWKITNGASSGNGLKSFTHPVDVAVDNDGNIYVVDMDNYRISKWSANGTAIGWIGGGVDGWNTSSGASAANYWENKRMDNPTGISIDDSYIYIVERSNNRISKWGLDGVYLGWIGKGYDDWRVSLNPDGSGDVDYHSFDSPENICLDGSGSLYVSDSANHRISMWHQGE